MADTDGDPITRADFDDRTAAIECAVSSNDAPALAAMVGYYRAQAAQWRAYAEERGETITTLKAVLVKNQVM